MIVNTVTTILYIMSDCRKNLSFFMGNRELIIPLFTRTAIFLTMVSLHNLSLYVHAQ